jgi:hypothetical protein
MKTRRGLLLAGLAGAVTLRATPAAAIAGNDRGLLEVLVAYQDAVVFAYELTLRSAPLAGGDKARLEPLRDEVRQEDELLRKALKDAGGRLPPARPLMFATLPPDLARQADRAGYVRLIAGSEEGAVKGWYAALQTLADPRLITGGVAFMAAGGRRLVVLRSLAGDPLLPHAFETGGL